MRQPAPTGQSMGYSCRSRQLCSAKALGQPRHRLRMRVERSAAASTGSATSHAAQQQEQQQAVVIGSGMAGLVAAEVLSRHFSHVVVLERDQPHPEWQQGAVDMAKVRHTA